MSTMPPAQSFLLCLSLTLSVFAIPQQVQAEPTATAVDSRLEQLGAQGKAAFHQGDFSAAVKNFATGAGSSPNDPRFALGIGASEYRQRHFEAAEQAFTKAVELAATPTDKARALYNLGNSQVQQGKLEPAVKSYEESLKNVADDPDTQTNLAFAKKLLEEKQKQQQSQQQQQQQNSQQSQGQSESQAKSQSKDGQSSKEENKQQDQQSDQQGSQNKQGQDSKTPEQQSQDSQQQSGHPESEPKDQSKEPKQDSEKESSQNNQQDSSGNKTNKEPQPKETQQNPADVDQQQQQDKQQAAASAANNQQEKARKDDPAVRAILESVQENKRALRDFRLRQAFEIMKEQRQKGADKDW